MERLLKNLRARLPKTYMGFPVGEGRESPDRKRRGVAMLVAILIISVMMLFTADLIVNSQVNLQLAVSSRDNLKAETMAQSALNAALLLISADFAYDLFQAQQAPQGAKLTDGVGDFWALLNGIPIGGETVEMLDTFRESFGLSAVLDSGILDQLKLFDGSFVLEVEDEGQKINVNNCHRGRCAETLHMLEALFSCPAEKAFLDKRQITAKELVANIKDWIDEDTRTSEGSAYSSENDPYERREPKMRAKNAPIDSIDELKLIEGWDDELHEVFAPFLTAWPLQEKAQDKSLININTANRALLWCLVPSAKGDCAEKSTLALKARNEDRTSLGGAGQKIEDILKQTLCFTGGAASEGEASHQANWFQESSTVFKVTAKGLVGDQEKVLTVVVQRTMPDPAKKQTASYKILYWRMI